MERMVAPASSSLATRIPLFPLQTVLFPGGRLPLRVFEVRYLDMIARCHKAGSPFGVVCLTRGGEVRVPRRPSTNDGTSGPAYAPEAFHMVGTLATIDELDRPQQGLMMVRCTGTQRFKLRTSEQLRHGLWMGEIELLPQDPIVPVPDDLLPSMQALQHLVHNLSARPEGLGDLPLQEPYHWDDCGWLANRWCELLPVSSEIKQRCMVLDNPLLRLELVNDMLERLGIRVPH
jgi:hypothetical protein